MKCAFAANFAADLGAALSQGASNTGQGTHLVVQESTFDANVVRGMFKQGRGQRPPSRLLRVYKS
jgi:hypothetical protein